MPLYMSSSVSRDPSWARKPPHVRTYANPPEFFRRVEPFVFTAPTPSNDSYQRWWRNWTMESPEWREEHYRADRMAPVMRKLDFETGAKRRDYEPTRDIPAWRAVYRRIGTTESETVRARGLQQLPRMRAELNRYATCSAMTGTQYQKPVTGVYGPMRRDEVFGVTRDRNRHGFLPATDYYF